MTKTLDENWIDWESNAFGFGYGTGENYTIPALKKFMDLVPLEGCYDYQLLEKEMTPLVAWLFINLLCHHRIDMLEYGTSPRGAWLTSRGKALKEYMATKTVDELTNLTSHDENYCNCYPDVCNCGPKGYQKGLHCFNPFWEEDAWRKTS